MIHLSKIPAEDSRLLNALLVCLEHFDLEFREGEKLFDIQV